MSTWQKPSFGVYDFSPSNAFVSVTHYVASRSGSFLLDFLKEKVFELENEQLDVEPSGFKKFKLDFEGLTLYDLEDSPKMSEGLWVPLTAANPRFLESGDAIRFGKQQLVVSAMRLDLRQPETTVSSKKETFLATKFKKQASGFFDSNTVCRICLEPNVSENPFVDICHCSKTMPMHLNCVREWMKRKCEIVRKSNVIFFNLSEVCCEVCKQEYPAKVSVNEASHLLFEPAVDQKRKHIVFNILDKKSLEIKGYVILYSDSSTSKFTIGRTDENDIAFDELSISRSHAELTLDKDGAKLVDLKSKYGSLLKIRSLDFHQKNVPFFIQIDKFLFEFHAFQKDDCFCPLVNKLVKIVEPWRGKEMPKKLKTLPNSQTITRPRINIEETQSTKKGLSVKERLEALKTKLNNKEPFKKVEPETEYLLVGEPMNTQENQPKITTNPIKNEMLKPENKIQMNQFSSQKPSDSQFPPHQQFTLLSRIPTNNANLMDRRPSQLPGEENSILSIKSGSQRSTARIVYIPKEAKSSRPTNQNESLISFKNVSNDSFHFN